MCIIVFWVWGRFIFFFMGDIGEVDRVFLVFYRRLYIFRRVGFGFKLLLFFVGVFERVISIFKLFFLFIYGKLVLYLIFFFIRSLVKLKDDVE